MSNAIDVGTPAAAPLVGAGTLRRVVRGVPWPLLVAVGLFFLAGMVGLVFLAAPDLQPLVFKQSLIRAFSPPLSRGGVLGTDQLGRPLEWRLLAGLGISLGSAVAVTVLASIIGLTMGLLGGFFGRTADRLVTVIIDLTWAYPTILLAVVIAGILGPGISTVIWALGLTLWAALARIVRAQVLVLREQEFVLAAQALGYGRFYIATRHLIPNLVPILILMATLFVALTIVAEAGLSFIGLGAQSPVPSLGKTLAEGFSFASSSIWPLLFGALTMISLIIVLNALGDRVRDILDPKGRIPTPGRLLRDLARRAESEVPTAPPAPDGVIGVDNISVVIHGPLGARPAVTDLSLTLRPGRTLGIVGESGSGKSLSARAITGLLPEGLSVAEGRVYWDGVDIAELSAEKLRSRRGRFVAMVFQDARASLDPLYTIGSQITESLAAHFPGSRRSFRPRVLEMLARVGLSEPEIFYDRYPHQLSGGQLQRAALAAVLVLEPRVLIADEPTTGLDATTQKKIVALVKTLQLEMNMSVIWISHDLDLVGEIADEIIVAYAGQPVETGPVDDVLARPAHPYTLGLLESRPQIDMSPKSMLRSVGGSVPDPGDWPHACRFAPRCRRVLDICRQTPPGMQPLGGDARRNLRCYNPEPTGLVGGK
jgi:peptide/nickel transport system permease protein